MSFFENILVALSGLKANRMRSLLTMLGIIIGISSVITISTIGTIATKSITDLYSSLGASSLVQFGVYLKRDASRNYYMDEDCITGEMLEDLQQRYSDEIDCFSIMDDYTGGTVRIRRSDYSVSVYGVNEGYIRQSMSKIVAGRFIEPRDYEKLRYTCVISDRQALKLFGSVNSAVGKTVSVSMYDSVYDFTVIGVYEYSVSGVAAMLTGISGEEDWNTDIYVPYKTMRLINGSDVSSDYYYWINIYFSSGVNVEEFSQTIVDYLTENYYSDNPDIAISYYTAESELAMFTQVLDIVSLVISVVAGIALLVGGIGVMNIMLVSVTERTREIGVRKALGAPNSAIRAQFIVESTVICIIGGIVGIVLGLLLGNAAGVIIGTSAAPSPGAILLAVGFSMAIGIFFGYYPANKAAKLDPIEALRYE